MGGTSLPAGENESGCRYSVLLKLPYFDTPRMLIVDPMHNLFLGTAKHFLKTVWIERDIISHSQFSAIQCSLTPMVPSDVGRIPCRGLTGTSTWWGVWLQKGGSERMRSAGGDYGGP